MKLIKLLSFSILTLVISCSSNKEANKIASLPKLDSVNKFYKEKLKKSFNDWQNLKKVNGNSYKYTTFFYAIEPGYQSSTEITVKNGEVIQRKFNSTINFVETNEKYLEKKHDLGTHKLGAKPITLDELYNTCATKYLQVDTIKKRIYFKIDSKGILKICGYYEPEIIDSGLTGVEIESFEWIK